MVFACARMAEPDSTKMTAVFKDQLSALRGQLQGRLGGTREGCCFRGRPPHDDPSYKIVTAEGKVTTQAPATRCTRHHFQPEDRGGRR